MSSMTKSFSVFLAVGRPSLIITEEDFFYLKISSPPAQPVVFFAKAGQSEGLRPLRRLLKVSSICAEAYPSGGSGTADFLPLAFIRFLKGRMVLVPPSKSV